MSLVPLACKMSKMADLDEITEEIYIEWEEEVVVTECTKVMAELFVQEKTDIKLTQE